MNNNVTDFGIKCRQLRESKKWTMIDVGNRLGYSQNSLTYIEQGKTNLSMKFLEECLKVYEIPETEKADFITKAFKSSNRFIVELDNVKSIPKDDLARLMAIIIFNLEESYLTTKEWEAVTKAITELKEGIKNRNLSHKSIENQR